MACAVPSCRNQIHRRPDLSFFGLPLDRYLRDEWLEVLKVRPGDNLNNVKVCELHFKPKDFSSEKNHMKQIKTHAVPAINLGTRKFDSIDSEDEFMDYNSDLETDIVEVPSPKITLKNCRVELKDIKKSSVKIEPEIEPPEEGRRPSRRAAREAAKKIYNTVRNFMPKEEDEEPYTPSTGFSAVSSSPQSRQRRRSVIPRPLPISIDLQMECHDDILSPAQAEALLKAQIEYNMVMKTLRNLKASNVKITIAKEPYPIVSQQSGSNSSIPPNVVTSPVSTNTSSVAQKPIVISLPLSENAVPLN